MKLHTKTRVEIKMLVRVGYRNLHAIPGVRRRATRKAVWRTIQDLSEWMSEFHYCDGYVKIGRDDPDLHAVLVDMQVITASPQGPSGTPFGSSKGKKFDEFCEALARAEKAVGRKARRHARQIQEHMGIKS